MWSPFLGRRVRPGGVAPQAGWAVWGGITPGRRRVRSVCGARGPIHLSSVWCHRARASTVKSSIPRLPQRAMLGCIRPPVGTDRSAFDLFKGGLRLWRGIHGPLWHLCIGWGVRGLVASLVDGVCGRAHDGLSWCWWRHEWTGRADRPGDRRAGVNASLPAVGQGVGPCVARRLAHASPASLCRSCPTTCVRMSSLAPWPAMTRVKPRKGKAPAASV
jgi:hypothetical protein